MPTFILPSSNSLFLYYSRISVIPQRPTRKKALPDREKRRPKGDEKEERHLSDFVIVMMAVSLIATFAIIFGIESLTFWGQIIAIGFDSHQPKSL